MTRSVVPPAALPIDAAAARRLERLAWWLDSSIPLPVGQWRIGLDALIGLVPGIGDLIGILLSSYILWEAARIGIPRALLVRMAGNVAIEGIVGAVPILGDLFDAAWKANQRNVRLLESYLQGPTRVRRESNALVAVLVAATLALLIGAAALTIFILRWLFSLVGSAAS
jgi:Domain of unknown function (DUF4112)